MSGEHIICGIIQVLSNQAAYCNAQPFCSHAWTGHLQLHITGSRYNFMLETRGYEPTNLGFRIEG